MSFVIIILNSAITMYSNVACRVGRRGGHFIKVLLVTSFTRNQHPNRSKDFKILCLLNKMHLNFSHFIISGLICLLTKIG